MNAGLPILLFLSVGTLLSGCAGMSSFSTLFDDPQPQEKQEPVMALPTDADSGIRYRAERKDLVMESSQESSEEGQYWRYRSPDNLYQPSYTHKSLNDYAQQLSLNLISNGFDLTPESRIGVASFVNFDDTLRRPTALGNQMAELLIAQVQQYGLSVVDFKTMGSVEVSRSGDLVMSRDARKLASQLGMDYILTGTLIQNEKGVRVNARIVSTQNRVLIASASVHIPHFIVQSLQPKVQLYSE